jgi:hypothetical protein
VAAVHCEAGNGTPPHGIYVLARAKADGPTTVRALLEPRQGMTVAKLSAHGSTITARLLGYSSDAVPRCCPDKTVSRSWKWRSGRAEVVRPALSANR